MFPINRFAKPYLITRTLTPENQETPIHFLDKNNPQSNLFFRRNHLPYPEVTEQFFSLPIIGEVFKPLMFQFDQFMRFPSKKLKVVLECSGNKRGFFKPRTFGEQWKDGAMSQGVWEGVPLRYLLEQTGLKDSVKEIVFEGHDIGERMDLSGTYRYIRSLPVDAALHPDTLVAYKFNGEPIPYKHGYPLRLVVPQWYGMASVKWLRRIIAIDHAFTGPFQTFDYVYEFADETKAPVTFKRVNSTILQPLDRSILKKQPYSIYGIAWAGTGMITQVEVSVDGGGQWRAATIERHDENPYSLVYWHIAWTPAASGEYMLMARARDSSGQAQPMNAIWNRKGYGFNGVVPIHIKIEG